MSKHHAAFLIWPWLYVQCVYFKHLGILGLYLLELDLCFLSPLLVLLHQFILSLQWVQQGLLFSLHVCDLVHFLLQLILQSLNLLVVWDALRPQLLALALQLLYIFINHKTLAFSVNNLWFHLCLDLLAKQFFCKYFDTIELCLLLSFVLLFIVLRSVSFRLQFIDLSHVHACSCPGGLMPAPSLGKEKVLLFLSGVGESICLFVCGHLCSCSGWVLLGK